MSILRRTRTAGFRGAKKTCALITTLRKKNRMTFRYTQDAGASRRRTMHLAGATTSWATYQGSWQQPSKSIMGRLTSQISSSLINDFEFGYAHNAIIVTPGGTDPTLSAQFDAGYASRLAGFRENRSVASQPCGAACIITEISALFGPSSATATTWTCSRSKTTSPKSRATTPGNLAPS